ncbi:MAG: Y-family DNA polymerase, partial [Pirellulaceae bacterium]
PSPPQESIRRILCLWLPNWPIQRQVVSAPELRRQRIVLYRQDSRRGQLVAAASPLASREGIGVDMPLSEAKSLLKRNNEDFHAFEHDSAADLAAIKKLADSLETFSPLVGLEEIEPAKQKKGQQPSSIFLDVTGLAHLFGDEYRLAHQLQLHCEKLGYLARIAIANTVGVAWGAARFFYQRCQDSSLAKEVKKKPLAIAANNLVILSPADQETFPKLPVAALRLDPATVETLGQLGIETVEQLLRLSRADLAMRFGNEIHRRLDQATGQIEEPLIARHPPPEFQAAQLLDYPTHHRKTIEIIIARLVTDICSQMQSQQRGALQWVVRLDCQSRAPLEIRVNLFQPTATLSHIMPLIEMQLEQLLQPHTRKSRKKKLRSRGTDNSSDQDRRQFHRYTTIQVQEISVSVTYCVLLVQQQRQLFDENPRLDKQALAHLINRLSGRLGQPNVVYPTLQAGAQPEYSFRFRPLVDIRRRRSRKPTKSPSQSHVIARPLRLFHPPIKIEGRMSVESGKSNVGKSDPPALLQFANDNRRAMTYKLQRHWGPERIETGWWRGRTICRDYWRVETETGQQLWIYQDRRSREWFLHGIY